VLGRPHSNSNANADSWRVFDTNADANTNTNAATYRSVSHAEPAAGIDIHFLERDFYMEYRNCDRQSPYRRQFAAHCRYLQLWSGNGAFGHGKQHSYGWTHNLCDPRVAGERFLEFQRLHLQSVQFFGYSDADASSHTYSYSNSNGHSDCYSYSYSYSYSNAHCYSYSNRHANRYPNANGYSNSDTNSYSNSSADRCDAEYHTEWRYVFEGSRRSSLL
jgi:hypothetical protein